MEDVKNSKSDAPTKKPSISKARKRRKNKIKAHDKNVENSENHKSTPSAEKSTSSMDSHGSRYAGNVNTPDASSLPQPPFQWLETSSKTKTEETGLISEKSVKMPIVKLPTEKIHQAPKQAPSYLQIYRQQVANKNQTSSPNRMQTRSSAISVLEPTKKSVSFADLNENMLNFNVPSSKRAKSNRKRRQQAKKKENKVKLSK